MEGGRTNDRPGTDHVTSGPMRHLEKTAHDGADRQTLGHCDSMAQNVFELNNQKKFNLTISGTNNSIENKSVALICPSLPVFVRICYVI